jgi:hypothetical protein
MSLHIALAAILPHLPAEIRADLMAQPLESACQALNLSKVENPENMRWLTHKRLQHSKGVSDQIVDGLRHKRKFLEKALADNAAPSIWLGYYLHDQVREVFLVDTGHSEVLMISEPIGAAADEKPA